MNGDDDLTRKFLPFQSSYGSVDTSTSSSEEYYDDNGEIPIRSIHRVNPSNVWTSVRFPTKQQEFMQEFDLVPSELTDNVKLVTDPSLEGSDPGALFYAEEAFYNPLHEPEYVLTVNPDIYQRLFQEVSDSRQVPLGLYFCCHGGDGAHTGVSHDDYVDIRVAWVLVSIILAVILFLG